MATSRGYKTSQQQFTMLICSKIDIPWYLCWLQKRKNTCLPFLRRHGVSSIAWVVIRAKVWQERWIWWDRTKHSGTPMLNHPPRVEQGFGKGRQLPGKKSSTGSRLGLTGAFTTTTGQTASDSPSPQQIDTPLGLLVTFCWRICID